MSTLAGRPRPARDPPAVDRAADGTPLYAPRGELVEEVDGGTLQCHLCGGWFRRLGTSHVQHAHGMTAAEYKRLVGLTSRHPLQPRELSERRAQHMRCQIAADPRLRRAMALGASLSRTGELQRRALEEMRERPASLERERQLAESGRRLGSARATAHRERRQQRARALGYRDLEDYYRSRYVDGRLSLDQLAGELGCAITAVRGDLQRLALGPDRTRSYGGARRRLAP